MVERTKLHHWIEVKHKLIITKNGVSLHNNKWVVVCVGAFFFNSWIIEAKTTTYDEIHLCHLVLRSL